MSKKKTIKAPANAEAANAAAVKTGKRKKQKKNKHIAQVKKPLICPPDKAGTGAGVRIGGYVCRAAVIFLAVFGLTFFLCDALRLELQELNVPAGFLAAVCFCGVALFSVMRTSKYGFAAGAVISVGTVVLFAASVGDIGSFAVKTVLTAKNVALTRLYNLGYYSMSKYMSEVTYTARFTQEFYLRCALAVVALLLSLVFVLCCIKRVRVIVPAAVSVMILGVVFTYNISRSNWGIALIIASFTGLLVMAVYDKIFTAPPDAERFDGETVLFADDDRPRMPEGAMTRAAARLLRKQKQAEYREMKRKHRREKTEVSVDEELTAYFGSSVKHKKKPEPSGEPADANEAARRRKEERAARRETDRQVAKVVNYDRAVRDSRIAQGGFAAAGACIVALLMLLIPTLTVSSSFSTIQVIDERMEYYREYVTAWLMGDDPILDELGYENDKDNFEPHSTTAERQQYTGARLFTVEIPYAADVYMRGWIATDYKDGMWYAVSDEQLERYRELFSTTDDPSETLFDNFYSIMDPTVNESKEFLTKYTNKSRYGVIAMQVNISRVETGDSLVYMPAYYRVDDAIKQERKTGHGLLEYGAATPNEATFTNYFDGIYTGRRFMSEYAYASVAYVTTMKNAEWYQNVAELIAQFEQGCDDARDAVEKYAERREKGRSASLDSIVEQMFTEVPEELIAVSGDDKTKVISVQYPRGVVNYTFDVATGEQLSYTITDLTVYESFDPETNETTYYTVAFAPPALSLEIRFRELMTTAQKRELADMYYQQYRYEQFVYDTYTGRSGSKIIEDTLDGIIAGTASENTGAEDGSTAATGNVQSFERAAERNSPDSEVYEQRHELVMAIVDYLQDGYTYTLEPTVPADEGLDGVENFLTVTKEGYCVQYASALALMLREVGIPARYVEGYVACDMHRNYAEDAAARYVSTVRDYNAHAWVEVWYDGVGWVQYEATPVYYEDMYVNSTGESSGGSVRPWYEGEDEQTTEEMLLESLAGSISFASLQLDTMRDDIRFLFGSGNVSRALDNIEKRISEFEEYHKTQSDFYAANRDSQSYDSPDFIAALNSLTEAFTTDVDDALSYQNTRIEGLKAVNKLIRLVIILVIIVTVAVLLIIFADRRAKKAEKSRETMIADILADRIPPEKRREVSRRLIDSVTALLAAYGSSPKKGEFRDEYAERLSVEYLDIFGRARRAEEISPDAPVELISDTDFGAIFNAVAAEEFGNGMTVQQMKSVAQFCSRLRGAAGRRLKPAARMRYHFIKHII